MWFRYWEILVSIAVSVLIEVNCDETIEEKHLVELLRKTSDGPVSLKLLYGESHGIFWTDLASQERLPPILSRNSIDILGLDYHFQQGVLYFSSWGNIWSLQLNDSGIIGEPTVVVEDAPDATSVAVDWLADRVYWTSPYQQKVWRVDLTNNDITVVLSDIGNISAYNNIVLDPLQGLLFLAVDGSGFIRSNLDGGDQWRASVESEEYLRDVTLTVDISRQRLYLANKQDHLTHLISCGYDGGEVMEHDLSSKWWSDFVSVGVYGDQLFWAHHEMVGRDTVYKANMSSDGSLSWELEYKAAPKPFTRVRVLKVYHPEIQTISEMHRTTSTEQETSSIVHELSSNVHETSSNVYDSDSRLGEYNSRGANELNHMYLLLLCIMIGLINVNL